MSSKESMLIFDLDGTLIDSNGVWVEVDKTFLTRRNLPYSKELHDRMAHTILQNCAALVKEYLNLEDSCEELINEWLELAKDSYNNVPLKPYVREYLERCQSAGHRMALFTACVPEHCRTALANHDLNKYFQNIFYAQELGVDKRSPEIFRHVAKMLDVTPKECVFFDDSLSACKAAKAAGMTVVGIHDSYFAHYQPDMRELCDQYIFSFKELL